MKGQKKYDIVVIGAGVAGCACSLALKKLNPDIRIAVVERKSSAQFSLPNKENPTTQEHQNPRPLRVGETIPPQSRQQLEALGIWSAFAKSNFDTSYGTASVWGSPGLQHNEFIYSPNGYGWHLDRPRFDQLMIQEAAKRDVRFLFDSRLEKTERTTIGWNLTVKKGEQGQSLKCSFVVDASGKKAAFATAQGASKISHDKLVGVHRFYRGSKKAGATVNGSLAEKSSPNSRGILIESAPEGWWYSCSLPDDTWVQVFFTDADIARSQKLQAPKVFEEKLTQSIHTSRRFCQLSPITAPAIAAAQTQQLNKVAGRGWLSVGDAAMSYDPLSSLGIFKALYGARLGSYAIIDLLKGNEMGLKKYAKLAALELASYQEKRLEYYRSEQRFKDYPFWQRRHLVHSK